MVQWPLLSVWLEDTAEVQAARAQTQDLRRSCGAPAAAPKACVQLEGGLLQVSPHQQSWGCCGAMPSGGGRAGYRVPGRAGKPSSPHLVPAPTSSQCSTVCSINSSSLLLCQSPAVPDGASPRRVFFILDNVHVDFASASGGQDFLYQPNPRLVPLSREGPARLKPGNVLDVEVRASATTVAQGLRAQAG